MNEYKQVKIALRDFLVSALGFSDEQVFRAPPKPTDINVYPIVIIRSATARKIMLNSNGPSLNEFQLMLGVMTRAQTSLEASDELDDLLKLLDTQIASQGVSGLSSSGLTDSRWYNFTRLDQQTSFDNAVQEDVGWIVYGATVGVAIAELTPALSG